MNRNDLLKTFALKAKRRLVGEKTPVSAKIKVIENTDEDFQSRVDFLLSQEDVVTNPVHYLMDDKILKNMTEEDKERYLLSTLDKYSSLRAKAESSSVRDFCI